MVAACSASTVTVERAWTGSFLGLRGGGTGLIGNANSKLKDPSYICRATLDKDRSLMTRTYTLGDRTVNRLGYGAMQLAGPGVFGPPKDRAAALAVLREAVAAGVNHIDTSDFYGPHVTNQIIREALHPYPEGLVIVTKVGARRGPRTARGSRRSRRRS